MHKESSKMSIVIAAIVALVIGGTAGYAAGMNKHDDSSNAHTSTMQASVTTTKAADLRVGLNNLLREHVSTSVAVTRDIVDNSPDLEASKAAQTANAVDIAKAVGSVYGEEAQATITPMFVDHISESNKFAAAVASGDQAAKEMAVVELNEYLNDIASFFSGAISTLPQDAVYGLLETHENLLNESIEAYKAGDFTKSYDLERQALAQAGSIGDALAKGIVETKPESFK